MPLLASTMGPHEILGSTHKAIANQIGLVIGEFLRGINLENWLKSNSHRLRTFVIDVISKIEKINNNYPNWAKNKQIKYIYYMLSNPSVCF